MPPKNVADKYQKLDPREHVLLRPGMYIGSIEKDNIDCWVVNEQGTKMEKAKVEYIAGLFKMFDEIVANAIDHSIRLEKDENASQVKNIKITIDKTTGIIEVNNDGEGIEIVIHPEHKIYIPQLIFGNLLTSTNYDENVERLGQGTNGIGCKACNIFSEWFEVETIDAKSKKKYIQRWEKNMSIVGPHKITSAAAKKPYTTIRFLPDYSRFSLKKLTDDMYEIMRKRSYDACAVTRKNINIWFNGEKLEYKDFQKYANLYMSSENERVYESISDGKWEIIASYNEHCGFEQISFVNGLLTIKGGTHVNFITNQIVKRIQELASKKKSDINVRPQIIKDNLMLFIKSSIVNPSFDSQSKETLTTTSSNFKIPDLSDNFIKKFYNTGIAQKIVELCAAVDIKVLKKTDGKKSNIIRGLPKLEDASLAGTARSKECVLILTEGDSAASMALAGIAENGRDRFGVFPLKGKVMNVKDANIKKIADNDEITNIKKILGLESGKSYTADSDIASLRYGEVMLMTDSDVDGAHIKGLIFNLFHSLWPSLIKRKGFITSLLTPIVKAKKRDNTISFYNLTDYENWREKEPNISGWKIKYYKGLGTSTNVEAKEYFKDMNLVTYNFTKDSDKGLDLAFNKKKADERKEWLADYDKQDVMDYKNTIVSYEDFVDKVMKHYSNYDNVRSLPSICDGLKTSQRKILWSCLKRNLNSDEIRVAQLAAYVSEVSSYHHGEASLQAAIVGMAQDFVGSNNINLLQPNGQFGTRQHGGKDDGQPRYIHTLLSPITSKIFTKHDNNVLTYIEDDGSRVEPEFYMPILPMILVNGCIGIGTGFSTSIPSYNPSEIINIIRSKLKGEPNKVSNMIPWYKGFKGTIKNVGEHKYVSVGLWERISTTSVRITELPVGYWTIDFKKDLEKLLDDMPEFKSYENKSADNINVILNFTSKAFVDDLVSTRETNGYTKLENKFGLVSNKGLTTSNMYAFNSKGQITKYDSPIEILNDFYTVRLSFYNLRKKSMLDTLAFDMEVFSNKIRFVKEVVGGKIKVYTMKKNELEAFLEKDNYKKISDTFDYLTRIPIYNFTKDKVAELEADVAKMAGDINDITKKSIEDMWLEDLQALSL